MDRPLTIGAREDGLARAQAEHLVRVLQGSRPRYAVHLELVRPEGSRRRDVHSEHFAESRRGIETLHRLLREGECDVVIHRGFDLRDLLPGDLGIAAIPPRCSPFDALVHPRGYTLDELEAGTPVGVVQLRARVQMLQYRQDLDLCLLPGDVASWLEALVQGKVEGLIMPNASVEHLGLQERVTEIFPTELVIPAPCSGMLVCVTRPDDDLTRGRLSSIHDRATAREYAAECSFLAALGCEWDAPVGAVAQCLGKRLRLLGMVADADGSRLLREGVEGEATDPESIGEALAEILSGAAHADPDWGAEADLPALGRGAAAEDLASLLDSAGMEDLEESFLGWEAEEAEWDEASADEDVFGAPEPIENDEDEEI